MSKPNGISTESAAWQMRADFQCGLDPRSPACLANLERATVPTPTLKPGRALVRIRAAALNFRDPLLIAQPPLHPFGLDPGVSPGPDGAGSVAAINAGSGWSVGDAVLLAVNPWVGGEATVPFEFGKSMGTGATQGALREYLLVPEDRLLRIPKGLTVEEAASLPTAATTAARALFFGPVPTAKETTILTQGTGGVSMAAISLAAAVGATVIATSSSDEKLQLARDAGAAETFNYKTHPDWDEEVLRLTSGRGVDHVLDVGGASTLMKSLRNARHGGHVSVLGILGPGDESGVTTELLMGAKSAKGCLGFSKEMISKVFQVMEEHDLHPQISEECSFEDTPKAFQALISQTKVGKLVIKI